MTYFPLSDSQKEWLERAETLAADILAPHAAETDREGSFPRRQLDALRDAGFMGLRADPAHGGQGEGLLTACLATEAFAKPCPSTALIYKMHIESIELVSRVPTPEQGERMVPRLASGEWLSTVAGSEAGHQGGAWAGAPKATVEQVDGGYQVSNARKSFVTAAGIADSYFFMCSIPNGNGKPPKQLFFQIQQDDLEWTIDEPWDGFGMRGNGSSPMTFNGFLPEARLINPEGKPADFFPVALATYAATYLGIAAGCFDLLKDYVAESTLADGRRMGEVETIKARVARCQIEIERSRALLYSVCTAFDEGRHGSAQPFFEAKVASDELGAFVTGEAMTLGGGSAFAKRLPFERYFRDARAGMVMGIAHDIAVLNVGSMLFPKPKKDEKPPDDTAGDKASD